ncbi:MAG: hypothetical protein H6697_07330 [Myxococcales bacterium]|nr:hypothetical protein [Myxococcales bacterium]
MRARLLFVSALVLAACSAEEDGDGPAADVGAGADAGGGTDIGSELPSTDVAVDAASDAPATIPGSCGYPMPTGFDIGQVVPDLVWENAYRADGTTTKFDLEEFFCDDAWDRYSSIHFIVTTGWCPNCPNYITYVDSLAEQIEAAGGLVVFLTTETETSAPATSEYSQEHISRHAPNGSGLRIGDGDASPAMQVATSPTIQFVPTSFVVRRSDMTVITDQRASEYNLPFVEIAEHPELDWSQPGAPTVRPDVPTACGDEDEEVYEPNNRVDDAKTITFGQFDGGICDTSPDFFRVEEEGRWSLYLGFDSDVGDLDVYIWDTDKQRPLQDADGNDIGSYSTTDDEYLEYAGPALVYVVGYDLATAPYTLLLNPLD